MTNFKKRLIGERINLFENSLTTDVKTFNMIFDDFPLDLENQEVEIGEIIKVNCYEIKTKSGNFAHYFERRKLDESIMPDDFSDDSDY